MDNLSPAVLPIPRLRLSRNAHLYETSGAGPSRSRFQDHLLSTPVEFNHNSEDNSDDDQLPTPRVTSTMTLSSAETPAERLRAVLARVPTSAKSTHMPHSPIRTPSILDSDFEPPDGYPATPSIARESLKAIFSRAVRDPGDTPQKKRDKLKRRNSIDASEVEASPRVSERTKNKGKRRSLSDEDVEKPTQSSEASFRSSQAATFDTLRERLTNSHTQIKDQRLPDSIYDQTIPDYHGHDTTTILRNLPTLRSPPAATSTPQESLRMSANSQFQFESNLLEQDSEMQRVIEGFDSYEDSGPGQRLAPFPPSRAAAVQSLTPKQHLPTSPQSPHGFESSPPHSKSHTLDKSHKYVVTRQGSEEIRSSSRTGSHSSLGHYRDDHSNQLREREREWNKPKSSARPHTPDLKHQSSHGQLSRSNSPVITAVNARTLSRRNSTTSLRSFDDDSSKGSSFGSQAEYRERINELERERNIEREREWNKRNPTPSRPRSSLSLNSSTGPERVRTRSLNQVSRSESVEPHTSGLFSRRPKHHGSPSNSSRASSPAGSFKANHSGIEESEGEEATHERERNWNAPRPKWTQHAHVGPPALSRSQSSTGMRVRAESLKANGTMRGESPVPPGKSTAESPSPSVIRLDSIKMDPPQQTPLPQEGPIPNHKSLWTHDQTGRSRSTLTLNTKGKEKESGTTPLAEQSKPRTQDLPSTSSSNRGFTFVRNRTVLPPIDFEKVPEQSTPSNTAGVQSPSLASGSRPSGSVKQSNIPVSSSRKEDFPFTSVKENTAAHEESYMSPKYSDFNSRSLALPSSSNSHLSDNQEMDDNNDVLSQERTPTVRTLPPPLLGTPEYTPPRSPSPPHHQNFTINDESRLQKAISANYPTPTLINTSATSTSLQEISPPPSPHVDQPRQTPQSSAQPILSTPPRRPSFSASKIEYQTPSPPTGLPELPGPPSSSGGDEDQQEVERERAFVRDFHSNLTVMKTPRPPGAWASTPGPQQRHEPSPVGKNGDDEARTPVRDLHSDFSTMKTPRAPGAWAQTPAPLHRETPPQSHSYAGDTETECESGLATPVASLSRASSLPLPTQTPAPPGAWMATPGARKSILKVRFDTHAPGTNQSPSNDAIESSNDFVDGITNASWHLDNDSVDTPVPIIESEEPAPRSQTPEPPSTPMSPSRSPRRSPRKSPGIRVLDAFGREQVSDNKLTKESNSTRNKSGIRVVDAMGYGIENSGERSVLSEADERTDAKDSPPLKHDEALIRIRQGLSDLANGLDAMNRADHDTPVDYARLRELNDKSRNSRATRERLSQTLLAAEADLRNRLEPLRASMKKNNFLATAFHRGLFGFRTNPWMFWGALFLQLLLILLMYRVSVIQARNTFLTTYYDPFYPDLHIYVFKPDTTRYSILPSLGTPWLSILDTLRREGWKASTGQIRNNISIMITEWQRLIWDAWGDKTIQSNISWPPT